MMTLPSIEMSSSDRDKPTKKMPELSPTKQEVQQQEQQLKQQAESQSPPYQDKDILAGRGGLANKHPGNRIFRRLVAHNKSLYQERLRAKVQPDLIIQSILQALQDNGVRFLKHDKNTGQWNELSTQEAWSKTSQALRELEKRRLAEEEEAAAAHRSNSAMGYASTRAADPYSCYPEGTSSHHLEEQMTDCSDEEGSAVESSSSVDPVNRLYPPASATLPEITTTSTMTNIDCNVPAFSRSVMSTGRLVSARTGDPYSQHQQHDHHHLHHRFLADEAETMLTSTLGAQEGTWMVSGYGGFPAVATAATSSVAATGSTERTSAPTGEDSFPVAVEDSYHQDYPDDHHRHLYSSSLQHDWEEPSSASFSRFRQGGGEMLQNHHALVSTRFVATKGGVTGSAAAEIGGENDEQDNEQEEDVALEQPQQHSLGGYYDYQKLQALQPMEPTTCSNKPERSVTQQHCHEPLIVAAREDLSHYIRRPMFSLQGTGFEDDIYNCGNSNEVDNAAPTVLPQKRTFVDPASAKYQRDKQNDHYFYSGSNTNEECLAPLIVVEHGLREEMVVVAQGDDHHSSIAALAAATATAASATTATAKPPSKKIKR